MVLTSVNVAPLAVLHGIKKSEQFKQQLLAHFPSLAADIHSFSNNPNCSCKNNIIKAVREKHGEYANFLEQFIRSNPQIDITDIPNMEAMHILPKNIAGETYTIHKDGLKDFYTNFLIKEKCVYKSCNIVPEGDSLKLYFL